LLRVSIAISTAVLNLSPRQVATMGGGEGCIARSGTQGREGNLALREAKKAITSGRAWNRVDKEGNSGRASMALDNVKQLIRSKITSQCSPSKRAFPGEEGGKLAGVDNGGKSTNACLEGRRMMRHAVEPGGVTVSLELVQETAAGDVSHGRTEVFVRKEQSHELMRKKAEVRAPGVDRSGGLNNEAKRQQA